MQTQKFAIITTVAALLLVISAVSTLTPQGATAYEKNQATSQTSACGNEFMPINIGCQNTDSQIQGDENAVALTAQQIFPEAEPEPQTCLECFTEFLTEEQITQFEASLSSKVGGNIEGLCAFWEDEATPEEIMNDLDATALILAESKPPKPPIADDATIEQLIDCLERVLGLQTE